jgi:electron transfer flavoprotein alpha subunit
MMKSGSKKVKTAVIAAHAGGEVLPETWDLAAFARLLHEGQPEDIRIYILGENIGGPALEIAERSGIDVTAILCQGLTAYTSEAYHQILASEFKSNRVSYICAPHNSQGLDYAPALAASLEAACISGVSAMHRKDSMIFFQKDIYGGKIKANMASHAPMTVLTIQPGAFKLDPDCRKSPGRGRVETAKTSYTPDRVSFLGVKKAKADFTGITAAKVVVAAGMGIGEQENMPLIHDLAGLFAKPAVGGTRIVCDRGWLDYSCQIGVTGVAISPALYIACGISGASQHVAGMQGAGFVVAINTDSQAAIFNNADICIVEDIKTFIPLLLETHKQQQNETAVHAAPDNEESGG